MHAIILLKTLFNNKIAITPRIREEILIPLEYGYIFPYEIIDNIKLVTIGEVTFQRYIMYCINTQFGKGELEAIAYCKINSCIFATNDSKARDFAKREDVTILSLQAILKAIWKKGLKSKNDILLMIQEIERVDNLKIKKEIIRDIIR
jgi:predicted nucleic acid-binding protein